MKINLRQIINDICQTRHIRRAKAKQIVLHALYERDRMERSLAPKNAHIGGAGCSSQPNRWRGFNSPGVDPGDCMVLSVVTPDQAKLLQDAGKKIMEGTKDFPDLFFACEIVQEKKKAQKIKSTSGKSREEIKRDRQIQTAKIAEKEHLRQKQLPLPQALNI